MAKKFDIDSKAAFIFHKDKDGYDIAIGSIVIIALIILVSLVIAGPAVAGTTGISASLYNLLRGYLK